MSAFRITLLIFLGVFVGGLVLFTRHNDFPFYYHPDEPGKVGQVIKNKRNFHHPLLMVTTVDLTRRTVLWGDAKKDSQRVAQIGRWVTAVFAALAAASLAALAARAHGPIAGLGVGALLIANPLLFELAHYFKEDPFLAGGIALTCLAVHRMRTRTDARGIALLGVATAVAAGAKYVGFALLPISLMLTIWSVSSPLTTRQRIAWLLGSFGIVWLALNWWIFKSPELLWRSLGEESKKAFGGEEGAVRSVPHTYYFGVQQNYSTLLLWIGCVVWFFLATFRKIRVVRAEAVLFSVAVILFTIFSFTPKTSPRYHLPASVAISYFCVVGMFGLTKWIFKTQRGLAITAGSVTTLVVLGFEIPRLIDRARGFTRDDRAELEEFVRSQLPAEAVIAQDEAVNLPEPQQRPEHAGRAPLTQRMIIRGSRTKQIADYADLAGLRAQGVTHVAICARTYLRFLQGGDTPERRFYETALERGKTVFSREPGMITYLQPGLSLIDITHLQ